MWPNTCNSAAVATCYTIGAGAWGNVANGEGGRPPAISGCGILGTHSTNRAGFVTSGITGICAVTITFDQTLQSAAPVGWSCSITNLTSSPTLVTDLFRQ